MSLGLCVCACREESRGRVEGKQVACVFFFFGAKLQPPGKGYKTMNHWLSLWILVGRNWVLPSWTRHKLTTIHLQIGIPQDIYARVSYQDPK